MTEIIDQPQELSLQTPRPIISMNEKKNQQVLDILSKYFSATSSWEKVKYLCVNNDKEDAAIRALEYSRWNFKDACALIEANLAWREKEGIDDILKSPIPKDHLDAIRISMGDGFFGEDLEGYPVYWCPAGKVDLASLKGQVPLQEIVKYHIQVMEYNQQIYLKNYSLKKKQTIHKVTCVIDLKGFGPRNLSSSFRECMSAIGIVDRDYYYDNMKRVIVINAPFVFRLFWKTASALFRPENRAKFLFLDKAEDLFLFISKSITPCMFGGDYDGLDALCSPGNPKSRYTEEFDVYINTLSKT